MGFSGWGFWVDVFGLMFIVLRFLGFGFWVFRFLGFGFGVWGVGVIRARAALQTILFCL